MELDVHKINQLRRTTALYVNGAILTKETNDLFEQRILANYAAANRKFPEGYEFFYTGDICTLGRAWAVFDDEQQTIYIVYSVSRNGFEFDALLEKNVNDPAYA